MKITAIRQDGLVGTLFYSGTPSSAIIVLGGSSGGMRESKAKELAEHGFATFALAYFGCETLPPTLKDIPLEYFGKAIDFLENIEGIERIGIWGGSRGGELSLILGTLFPERIQAIAAHVPSSVVYGAFDSQSSPAWTLGGNPIAPCAPFTWPNPDDSMGQDEATSIALTPYFLSGMENFETFSQSAIPVEKISCPLLLISAKDDQMWPSALYANQIIERLAAHDSLISCTHISYAGVGHAPSHGAAGLHPIISRWFAYGGNPENNAAAAKDWLSQTVQFFKEKI